MRLELQGSAGAPVVSRAGLVRTARKLFDGAVFVPSSAVIRGTVDVTSQAAE